MPPAEPLSISIVSSRATTGLTPKAYATAHRSERMRAELGRRKTVTEAIYEAGFNLNGRFLRGTLGNAWNETERLSRT